MSLNKSAEKVFDAMVARAVELRIESHKIGGATVLDCGAKCPGGLEAGIEMAKLCLAGPAEVSIVPGDRFVSPGPWVSVRTDWPVEACMFGQYAGWPVKAGDYFAMGSGPMRIKRGKEDVLKHLGASDDSPTAVGTLETAELPTPEVIAAMADECSVDESGLRIAVAPTSSLAGNVQVVARSVETSLHKLHELGFDLPAVKSAYGLAPLPTPTPDFAKGIGRTNDAILYGGSVVLYVDSTDDAIQAVVEKVPSCASADFGRPFHEIFKGCGYDFYKIDPGLFSPAEVTIVNLATGNSNRAGGLRSDLIARSFGYASGEGQSANHEAVEKAVDQ